MAAEDVIKSTCPCGATFEGHNWKWESWQASHDGKHAERIVQMQTTGETPVDSMYSSPLL